MDSGLARGLANLVLPGLFLVAGVYEFYVSVHSRSLQKDGADTLALVLPGPPSHAIRAVSL